MAGSKRIEWWVIWNDGLKRYHQDVVVIERFASLSDAVVYRVTRLAEGHLDVIRVEWEIEMAPRAARKAKGR